jgi:hypothetical protein
LVQGCTYAVQRAGEITASLKAPPTLRKAAPDAVETAATVQSAAQQAVDGVSGAGAFEYVVAYLVKRRT